MSGFFDNFPTIQYDMNQGGFPMASKNIMVRYRVREIIRKYAQVMFEYVIKDGEKPFIVADKYYGRPELSELILLTNDMIDPYYDWPLSTNEFDAYLISKYGSIEASTQRIHSYWQIIQPRTEFYDGTLVPERLLRIDASTYATLNAEQRKHIYCYDYEVNKNEAKRQILLIKKSYISQVESEIKNIFK